MSLLSRKRLPATHQSAPVRSAVRDNTNTFGKSPIAAVMHLQRTIGNRAVMGLLRSGSLQAKLQIGTPGDRYEREADSVAHRVVSMPEAAVQRVGDEKEKKLQTSPLASGITPLVQTAVDEEEKLQKATATDEKKEEKPLQRAIATEEKKKEQPLQKTGDAGGVASLSHVESAITAGNGGGHPLADGDLNYFEPRFGASFGDVRAHTDSRAAQLSSDLNAQAFTVGKDVYFGAGKFDTGSSAGKRLLAHELTHVVQQDGNVVRMQRNGGEGEKKAKELKLLKDFAAKFPAAAELIRKSLDAMKLVEEAAAAGTKFGGYAEDGPGKRAWPYTVGDTVYISKARADVAVATSDFLFELNNASRAPKFAAITKEAVKGTKGKLTARQYAYQIIDLEVEGMLRLGKVWFEMKKTMKKGENWDTYDGDFFLAEYTSFKEGKKSKEDIIKDVLSRVRTHEPHNGMTVEQHYMEQYKELSGGR